MIVFPYGGFLSAIVLHYSLELELCLKKTAEGQTEAIKEEGEEEEDEGETPQNRGEEEEEEEEEEDDDDE